jgi:ribosomal RNA-processing protein 9
MNIDSYVGEHCATVGFDATVRYWKVVQSTQLVFKAHTQCVESVAIASLDTFVTGSQDGYVAFWSTQKKYPFGKCKAHEDGALSWITAVAALKHTDLVASGGSDGEIKLWRATPKGKRKVDPSSENKSHQHALQPIASINVPGFINGLAFGKSGRVLVAAIGKEHRLGRWATIKEARNGIAIINLNLNV